jgi:hypothetical protein
MDEFNNISKKFNDNKIDKYNPINNNKFFFIRYIRKKIILNIFNFIKYLKKYI